MRITAEHSSLSFAQQSAEQAQAQVQVSREPSVVAATRVASEDPTSSVMDNNNQSRAQARSPTVQEAKTQTPGLGKKKKKREDY